MSRRPTSAAGTSGDGIEPVIKHLKHILDVVGEDTPALGSDWDGFIVPTPKLADPRGLPLLTDALLEAGIAQRVIGKILRGNPYTAARLWQPGAPRLPAGTWV